MKYDILDLGLVYYKDIIPEPQLIIDEVEKLELRSLEEGADSIVGLWSPWMYGDRIFNWQKFFPRANQIPKEDPFYQELTSISSVLYDSLDKAFSHYSKEIYPFANANIKSEEYEMHLLKYGPGGHLPAHQDQGVSSRVLSTVMYLNDNYTGGEIEFKHSNVKLRPSAGSIIFFPSNFLYVHEVYPIDSGVRYSVPHWYHNIKDMRSSTGEE
jgi:Rps23 Pro-64 3,4-dihydroxylase Tpa1-like proline 4-hydroxylase